MELSDIGREGPLFAGLRIQLGEEKHVLDVRAVFGGIRSRALLIGIAATVAALGVASAGSAARSPVQFPGGALDNVNPVFTPLGLSNKATTVVLQLTGDPVTVVDASTPLTKDQKKTLKGEL